jgi:hypothetical protein
MNQDFSQYDKSTLKAMLEHKKEQLNDDSFVVKQPVQVLNNLYKELKAIQYELAVRESQATEAEK